MSTRNILFRGKDLKTNKWVYGYYIWNPNGTYIIAYDDEIARMLLVHDNLCLKRLKGVEAHDWRAVNPATVGEVTGWNDCTFTEIFEGDIICCKDNIGIVEYGDYKITLNDEGDSIIGFHVNWIQETLRKDLQYWVINYHSELKIVGNIFDNINIEPKFKEQLI